MPDLEYRANIEHQPFNQLFAIHFNKRHKVYFRLPSGFSGGGSVWGDDTSAMPPAALNWLAMAASFSRDGE
jgi:hypothetical protein